MLQLDAQLLTPFNASPKTCSFVKGIHVFHDELFLLSGITSRIDEVSDEELMKAVLADKRVRESYYVHIEIVHALYFGKEYRLIIIAGIEPSDGLEQARRYQDKAYSVHKNLFPYHLSVERDVAKAACKHYGIRWID